MRALKQVTAGRVKANHRNLDDSKKEKVSDYEGDRRQSAGRAAISLRNSGGGNFGHVIIYSAVRPSRKVAKTAGKNRDLRALADV
jgi:hypothetical protein